jgi:hypothetical protein
MDMTTTYDGTLLDHLAKHMMYLSAASSFWFNLNSRYGARVGGTKTLKLFHF